LPITNRRYGRLQIITNLRYAKQIPGGRQNIARERDAAFSRLQHYLTRRAFLDVSLEMEPAIARAAKLSAAHTERLGARAIDLLHVACALTLESELFLTTDTRQAQLAKAEGLKVAQLLQSNRGS
jgi:predicted nucleic acid-binding protein